jgi:soluble lytic murein transglycosylase-like protein
MLRLALPSLLVTLLLLTTIPASAVSQGGVTEAIESSTVLQQQQASSTPPPASPPPAPPAPSAAPTQAPPTPTAPSASPPPTATPTAMAPTSVRPTATTAPSPTATAVLKAGGQLLVAPETAAPGMKVEFAAKDFGSREKLSVWLTDPAGATIALPEETATKEGEAYFATALPPTAAPGRWAATAQGQESKRRAIARFTVAGAVVDAASPAAGAPGQPAATAAPGATATEDPTATPEPTETPPATETPEPTETPTPSPTPVDNSDIAGLLPPAASGETLSPRLARTYFGAAARLTGVPVEVLLAVAAVESGFRPNAVGPLIPQFAGTIDEHALGMMQFLPSTYRPYAPIVDRITGKGLGMRGIWDPESAVYAAALYLRDSGAARDMRRALFAYNNADWYVRLVLAWADFYAKGGNIGAAPVIDRAKIYALPDPLTRTLSEAAPAGTPVSADGQARHAAAPPLGLRELLSPYRETLGWPRIQRMTRPLPD